MRGSRWGGGGQEVRTRSLKIHKKLRFLSNTATKPAFNVGPSSARQRNAIQMAFRWRTDNGPLIVVFGDAISTLKKTPQTNKKKTNKNKQTKKQKKKKKTQSKFCFTPSEKPFWIRACIIRKFVTLLPWVFPLKSKTHYRLLETENNNIGYKTCTCILN